jgi:multidrug efflux pump subunit AcrB
MNVLKHALRRPLTVLVIALTLALGGIFGAQRMPKDVFPPLNVPTIYVAQPFGGMEAGQMEGFLTYYYEYHFLYITGIEHVESRNIQGAAVMKLQFHSGTDMAQAMSETVSYVNRARAMMPPGTVPPFVMRFDAGMRRSIRCVRSSRPCPGFPPHPLSAVALARSSSTCPLSACAPPA